MKLTLITIGILILFLYILILYCCILVGARSERRLRQFLENRNPSQDDHSISGRPPETPSTLLHSFNHRMPSFLQISPVP